MDTRTFGRTGLRVAYDGALDGLAEEGEGLLGRC
jgi:hypothetical protein